MNESQLYAGSALPIIRGRAHLLPDSEVVRRVAAVAAVLNTPPHRNLDGERGAELGEDREAGVKPDET